MSTSTPVPAGWYPDPSGSPEQRYWDGQQWTGHTAPASTAQLPRVPDYYGTLTPAPQVGSGYSVTAIVLGILAVFVLPILFGPAAIVLAALAMRRGERQARAALVVAISGTVLGMVLGVLVALAV